jgi:4'-phosphopantetheinyl transferase EntD
MKTLKITQNIEIGIAQVGEFEKTNLVHLDTMFLNEITHLEKQNQFITSRLLAKNIIENQGVIYNGLDKNQNNAPILPHQNWYISISHTQSYTSFVVDKYNPVGIDIEQNNRLVLLKLQHKFLSEKEKAFTQNNIDLLTFFWSAKEALYKLYQNRGLIFKDDMHIDYENKKAILFPNTEKQQIYEIFEDICQEYCCVCVYKKR